MKIPVGEFGLRAPGEVRGGSVPVSARAPTPNVAPGAFVTPGLESLGEGGLKIGAALANEAAQDAQLQAQERHQAQQEAKAEAKRIYTESKRAEAMTIHAEAANALGDAHDRLLTGLAAGAVTKEDAPRLWQEQSQQIADDHLARVDQANSQLVRASMAGDIGRFGRNVNQAVVKRAQSDIGAQLNATLEQLQRTAERDLPNAVGQAEMALDSLGPQAGLNPEQIGKAKQGFKEAATFNKLNNELIGARTSTKALTAVQATIADNQDLDPAKRNALLNAVQNQQLHLQNVAEAAQRRREASATRAMNSIEKQISMGIAVDPQTWVATQSAVRGTEYAPLVEGLMTAERDTQALLSKPIPEQIAAANAAEAKANTGEGGLAGKVYADRLKKTVNNNVAMLTKTPLVYAIQRQGADATPLDLNNLGSWGDILNARLAAVDPISKQYGVKKSLLLPGEDKQLAGLVQGANTGQALQVFAALRSNIIDDRAYRDTVSQIAPDSPVHALAGVAVGRQDLKTAEFMLRGQSILSPNKKEDGKPHGALIPMPKETDMESQFATEIRDAYAGKDQARSAVYQAARAIYAAQSSEAGGDTAVLDSRRWKDSIKRAVGDVERYRGRSVVLPRGVDYGQFKDGVRARVDALVSSGALDQNATTGRLLDLPLENVGDAQYILRAGDSKIVDKTGREVVLDFNVPAPIPAAPQRRGQFSGFGETAGGAVTGLE